MSGKCDAMKTMSTRRDYISLGQPISNASAMPMFWGVLYTITTCDPSYAQCRPSETNQAFASSPDTVSVRKTDQAFQEPPTRCSRRQWIV